MTAGWDGLELHSLIAIVRLNTHKRPHLFVDPSARGPLIIYHTHISSSVSIPGSGILLQTAFLRIPNMECGNALEHLRRQYSDGALQCRLVSRVCRERLLYSAIHKPRICDSGEVRGINGTGPWEDWGSRQVSQRRQWQVIYDIYIYIYIIEWLYINLYDSMSGLGFIGLRITTLDTPHHGGMKRDTHRNSRRDV